MACLRGTKPTRTRATVTQYHKGGRPALPTMSLVRAFPTTTYRVQTILFERFLYKSVLFSTLNRGVKPFWFSQIRFAFRLFFHCMRI